MSWTDERVETLKKLWGEGRTAAEIAAELGGVTRNAVIGKAHRLKLSGRASPIKKSVKKKPANTNAAKPKKVEKIAKAPVEAKAKPVARKETLPEPDALSLVSIDQISEKDKNRKRVPLIALGPNMCRWPLGDPRDKDFGFCGCKAKPGSMYCDEHAAMAYQVVSRGRTLSAEDLEREEKARAEKMALNADNY